MSKKPIIGGIILASIIGLVAAGAQINPEYGEEEKHSESEVWSTRIVGDEVSYSGSEGVSSWGVKDSIDDIHEYPMVELERLTPYKFNFVPMGDSPHLLKISIGHDKGVLAFERTFVLERTLVDTGISKYYTWDYTGEKIFQISTNHCPNQNVCDFDITVQRKMGLDGSVSVSISRMDASI